MTRCNIAGWGIGAVYSMEHFMKDDEREKSSALLEKFSALPHVGGSRIFTHAFLRNEVSISKER